MAYTLGEAMAPTAGRKSNPGKGWELTGFSVKFAENGYSVDCSYERQGGKEPGSYRTETKVFESARKLIAFLEDTLEGDGGGSDESEEDDEAGEKEEKEA